MTPVEIIRVTFSGTAFTTSTSIAVISHPCRYQTPARRVTALQTSGRGSFSAARSFALRARGLAATSAGSGVSGFWVSSLTVGVGASPRRGSPSPANSPKETLDHAVFQRVISHDDHWAPGSRIRRRPARRPPVNRSHGSPGSGSPESSGSPGGCAHAGSSRAPRPR